MNRKERDLRVGIYADGLSRYERNKVTEFLNKCKETDNDKVIFVLHNELDSYTKLREKLEKDPSEHKLTVGGVENLMMNLCDEIWIFNSPNLSKRLEERFRKNWIDTVSFLPIGDSEDDYWIPTTGITWIPNDETEEVVPNAWCNLDLVKQGVLHLEGTIFEKMLEREDIKEYLNSAE